MFHTDMAPRTRARLFRTLAICILLFARIASASSQNLPVSPDSMEGVRALLQKLIGASYSGCGAESGIDYDVVQNGRKVFAAVVDRVARAMNSAKADGNSPQDEARAFLVQVEQLSANINSAWPKENRFHFLILDISPIVVVKMNLGSNQTFYVFAKHENDSFLPSRIWHEAGSDDLWLDREPMWTEMDVHSVPRGPSGNARFISSTAFSGCMGSSGLEYDMREWDPEFGELNQVLKQDGAMGMDEAANGQGPTRKDPFAPIGKFEIRGAQLNLPYCWFSPIDWWDNPSLCALDTYDASGDEIRFRSRAYNRPELVPIAKALGFAEQHDYPATRAYCASDSVARQFFNDPPGIESTENPKVTQLADGKLRVQFVNSSSFVVVKRADRWVIESFRME